MKSLRKSLQRDSSHNSSFGSISGPLPNSVSKPAQAVIPPNKVIRASADHRSTAATELSFKKGDFFYVVKEVNGGITPYYEAHNPLTGARGLVPRTLFEELVKGNNRYATQSPASTIDS
jgi:bud emergence protein 1